MWCDMYCNHITGLNDLNLGTDRVTIRVDKLILWVLSKSFLILLISNIRLLFVILVNRNKFCLEYFLYFKTTKLILVDKEPFQSLLIHTLQIYHHITTYSSSRMNSSFPTFPLHIYLYIKYIVHKAYLKQFKERVNKVYIKQFHSIDNFMKKVKLEK